MCENILDIRELTVEYRTENGIFYPVHNISLSIKPGETLALVGESGCGKSTAALAIMNLLPPCGKITHGSIVFNNINLCLLSEKDISRYRGRHIGMIFQEPMTALNPVFTIQNQLQEVFHTHTQMNAEAVYTQCVAILTAAGIADPKRILSQYPHELSGGMRQRIVIAMAAALKPELLIADEPTTALDVTIQAQIMRLFKKMRKEHRSAMLLITHDLALVAEEADTIAVIYGGKIVEMAPTAELFNNPLHPYTRALLKSIPGINSDRQKPLFVIEGSVSETSPSDKCCVFFQRCPYAVDQCALREPGLEDKTSGHAAACIIDAFKPD